MNEQGRIPLPGGAARPTDESRRLAAGNFAGILRHAAEKAPLHPAIDDSHGIIDYQTFAALAGGVSQILLRNGLAMGDRVAIRLNRGPAAAAAFFGVLASGGIAVGVNETLRARQIEHILRHSGARFLLSGGGLRPALPAHLEDLVTNIEVIATLRGALDPVLRIGDDPAHIIYTSGSTGMPKGVTISHGNLWAGAEAVTDYLGLHSEDRIASLLPFSFDYGLNQLLCAVHRRATLVVERSPIPARIAMTLREKHVTVLPAVPPLWLQLLGSSTFRGRRLQDLRILTNTGGRLPRAAVAELLECQPQAQLFLMYGLTEAFRSTYLDPGLAHTKPDSIGRAIPGAEVIILDEDDTETPPGSVGELVHRGPTVSLGYWNDPDATEARFRPNPLRPTGTPAAERIVFSGDLAYRDEDGDLFFVGRRDKMIKTLGYRVSPDEIVDELYASGEVREAVVTAEPDETAGSRIVAFVVLAPAGDLDRLWAFVGRELPQYLQPRRIEVRSSLARTSSGKHDVTATAEKRD